MSIDDEDAATPSGRTIAQAFSDRSEKPLSTAEFCSKRWARADHRRRIVVARANAAACDLAAAAVRRAGGPESVAAIVARGARDHEPGGNDAINQRERMFHLCIALCDIDDPAIARELRNFLRRHRAGLEGCL